SRHYRPLLASRPGIRRRRDSPAARLTLPYENPPEVLLALHSLFGEHCAHSSREGRDQLPTTVRLQGGCPGDESLQQGDEIIRQTRRLQLVVVLERRERLRDASRPLLHHDRARGKVAQTLPVAR